MSAYKRITFTERLTIEKKYNRGESISSIARFLHRAVSGISYEIRHGLYDHLNGATYEMEKKYSAQIAQERADYIATSKGQQVKLGKHHDYAKTVAKRIKAGESPDSIVGTMKRDNLWTVSTTTLYRYIYQGFIPGITEKDLLEKPIRKSRSVSSTTNPPKRAPKGESIEKRPEEINKRETFGHWEQDTVIGKSKGKEEALLVLTERKSRFEIILKLAQKTAQEVTRQLRVISSKYPKGTFKTITVDNGSENQDYIGMKEIVSEVYYCHPYSSYERGSNERQNRIIRRYFPKGESMSGVSQEDAERAQDAINGMHRKILGYATSAEVFAQWQAALT